MLFIDHKHILGKIDSGKTDSDCRSWIPSHGRKKSQDGV